jgi:hypothetical protein
VRKATGRGKDGFKIRDLFADERCTGSILDFLRTTDVRRGIEPDGAKEQAQREDSDRERELGGDEEEEDSGREEGGK